MKGFFKYHFVFLVATIACLGWGISGCDAPNVANQNSDELAKYQQEHLTKQAAMKVGMPAITRFREREELKMIFEMRDRATVTYTYTYSQMDGKLHFFCNSIGYPIPYSTEFTNPSKFDYQRIAYDGQDGGSGMNYTGVSGTLPQADPNSLFPPASAAGTWVMCQDPANPSSVLPVYSEPDVIASPFPLQGIAGPEAASK